MHTGCALTVLTVALAALAGRSGGVEMAKIRGKMGQTLTSSTLEWVDVEEGQAVPEGALPVSEEGGPVWCRARQHSTWVPGAASDGQCVVPFLNRVNAVREYEVLVSINDSARVVLKEWDSLQALPLLGITSSKMLLALVRTGEEEEEGGGVSVSPGHVDIKRRRAFLLKGGKYSEQKSALVLTEDEPVHYEVDQVARDEKRSATAAEEEVLCGATLENPAEEERLVGEMLDYVAKEVLYWGRVRGTITSLAATVVDPPGNPRGITWGNENELDQMRQQRVEFRLPAGTGVNVTLIAIQHKYEAPYSAKLTAVYRDQERRSRTISGLHIHRYLAELRANFSKPFYLSNSTEVEGEFATSEILIHSTTTTTTSTTTAASPSAESVSDDEKPHSESLAAGDGEGKDPTAEKDGENGDASKAVPGLVSLCCSLLAAYHLTLGQ